MRGKGKEIEKEKKTQETLWSNMGHLMRVLSLQFRSVYYCIIILAILVPFWNLLQVYIETTGYSTPWYLHMCGGSYVELLVMLCILLGSSYNILSRNEISMYPGTVISRYGATVLLFHLMMLLSVLASVVSYLLQGLLLWVASCFWDDFILGNLFSASYLWYGSVRYLAMLFAASAVGIFWFVLIERFRAVRVYLCTFALFGGMVILAKWGYLNGVMQTLKDLFLGNGYSFAALIVVLFGIWAVLLFLSTWLAGTVKAWREADKIRIIVAAVLMYFLSMGAFVMVSFLGGRNGYSYEMDPQVFQRETNYQAEVIVDISEWEEEDKTLLSLYEMSVQYRDNPEKSSPFYDDVFASVACSASEAKRYGLSFDESKLDQDHVILLLGSRSLTFAGKDLGKDALQAFQQSTKLRKDPMDEQYQDENPEEEFQPDYYYQTEITNNPVIVINTLYGNLEMYMDDTTVNSDFVGSLGNVNVIGSLLRIVIYSD